MMMTTAKLGKSPNSTRMYSKSFCFSQLHPRFDHQPTAWDDAASAFFFAHDEYGFPLPASQEAKESCLKTNRCSNKNHPTSDHHPNGTKARNQDRNHKKTVGSLHLDIQWLPFDLPPKKKKHDLFGMGDYILFGCQWLPYPEPKALIMLQARYATCFPTSQMDFTSRFTKQHGPRFFEEFRGTNALLISGNLFGSCFSEMKLSPPNPWSPCLRPRVQPRPGRLPKTNPVESKYIQKALKIHLILYINWFHLKSNHQPRRWIVTINTSENHNQKIC